MVAQLFDGIVFVAVIQHGTIIRAEDNECVFRDAQTVECLHQFTHAPIELQDAVAARTLRRLPLKTLVSDARDMDILRGKVQEERVPLIRLDEAIRLAHPGIGEVFVTEAGTRAPGVEANAADPVMNGLVVTV